MMALVKQFRQSPSTVKVLCLNQFGINAGFYMLMPYLAAYLSGSLGLAAGVVGLLLGIRNFSQQGMFFAGGALADRFGHKPMIMTGCLLRVIGFGALAMVDSMPGLLLGMAATGAAGALFNPAVRACLAEEAGDARRIESFAVFNVFYQAGILAGPIIGLTLSAADFRITCLVAAGVFGVLTIAQARFLPSRRIIGEGAERPSVRAAWRTVLTNRRFLLFSLVMAWSYVLNFQTYLALPLLLGRHTAPVAATVATTAMFAASGILTVAGQVRITAWCRARWGGDASLVIGMLGMGAAFLPIAVVVSWRPGPEVVIAAVLVCGILLATGTMISYPFEMDTIMGLAGERYAASHYGIYQTIAGIGIATGNLAIGGVLDATRSWPWLPWLGLAAIGAAAALGLRTVTGRIRVEPAQAGAVAAGS